MHILLLIAGKISAGVFWWYRMRDAANIAGEVVDKAQRVRGAHKRRKFRDKAAQSPYAAIDDPAEQRLREKLKPLTSEEMIDEAVIYGKWAEKQGVEMSNALRLIGPPLTEMLNENEREYVVAMADDVIVENTSKKKNALRMLRQRLRLQVDS